MIKFLKSSYTDILQFEIDHYSHVRTHISNHLELIYVLSGSIEFEICGVCHKLGNDGIIVINPFEVYEIRYSDDAHTLSLFLNVKELMPFDTYVLCSSDLPDVPGRMPQILDYLANIFRLFNKDCEANKDLILDLARDLCDILSIHYTNPGNPAGKAAIRNTLLIHQTLDYIHRNYMNDITISEMAGAFFVSPAHLSRRFSNDLGLTIVQYLKEIRLEHACEDLQDKQSTLSVTEIALKNGFGNANAFISAFKEKFNSTPGKFRNDQCRGGNTSQAGLMNGLSILEKHAGKPDNPSTYPERKITMNIDPYKEGLLRKRQELMILNVSWIHNVLYATIREQIHKCQQEIGFRYIRCHGIFDNPMHIFNIDSNGQVYYNFSFVDMAYDFIRDEGLIPYVEFSYIPHRMSQTPTQDFWCRVNMSMPSDLELWKDLIVHFLEHCIERYGLSYVRTWKFTIIQAIHVYMGNFSLEDYFELYKATYLSVKSVDPALQIGGPGSQLSYDCFSDFDILRDLYELCRENQCIPDFLAFEIFHNIYIQDGKHIFDLASTHTNEPLVISDDPNWLLTLKTRLNVFLKNHGLERLPVYIDCWNSTMWQRDPSNDTCYKSAFILKNMLEYGSLFDGFGFWHMSDLNDELSGTSELYHGGYGLFTQNGIPKSGFNAYVFLRMLGDHELLKGEGCYVSRNSEHDIRIILYNYCHFDFLGRQNIHPESTKTNRYAFFQNEVIMDYHLTLNLDPGTYKLESYIISGWQQKGSSYDIWAASGAPDRIDKELSEYLTDQGRPGHTCSMLTAGEEPVTISRKLQPLESMLLIIRKTN